MTNKIKELETLTDKELEEKIINLNREQLSVIKKSSYFNAIYSMSVIRDNWMDNTKFPKDNYVDEGEELNNYILEICDLIKNPDKKKVLNIREQLIKKKNIIEGYLIEIDYLSKLIDEYGILLLSDTREFAHFHKESVDEVIDSIHKVLYESQKDHNKYMFIISEIVKILPMRLIKQNYYSILENTIKRNFVNRNKMYIDTKIDDYKRNFDSSVREGYGIDFDFYFMEIHKIKRQDLKNKTLDQLSVYIERILKLTEELNGLKEIIDTLGMILNMLIVIDLLKDIEIDMSKLIEEWNVIYKSEDELKISKFNEFIEKELQNIEYELQKDVSYYGELTIEASKREDLNNELLDEELIKTRQVLSYYNDLSFSSKDILEDFDTELVEKSYIKNSIESLFDYMNRSMDNMENRERKIRMKNILSILELPFENIKEFTGYIRYALDSRVVDVRVINFKINQIIYFLNEVKDK